jgi:hypothetical protein
MSSDRTDRLRSQHALLRSLTVSFPIFSVLPDPTLTVPRPKFADWIEQVFELLRFEQCGVVIYWEGKPNKGTKSPTEISLVPARQW